MIYEVRIQTHHTFSLIIHVKLKSQELFDASTDTRFHWVVVKIFLLRVITNIVTAR